MADSENMELEPPKISDVRKIADLDSDIKDHDNPLDTITEIIEKRVSQLEDSEPSGHEEMSVTEHQQRLAKTAFSHEGNGSPDNEDLSDDDRSVKDIQDELSRRIFSHD